MFFVVFATVVICYEINMELGRIYSFIFFWGVISAFVIVVLKDKKRRK